MSDSDTAATAAGGPAANPAPRRKVLPAITPGLRKLFYLILIGLALLGANSLYLAAITFLGFLRDRVYENQFYLWMFFAHLALGILLTGPFLWFGVVHIRNTWGRRNKKALRSGYLLFSLSLGVIVTGFLMTLRVLPVDSLGGRVSYWVHVLFPVLAILVYIAHRSFGPKIKWSWGIAYALSLALIVGGMAWMHTQDPRAWNVRGGGEAYFHPSEARTANLGFIPQESLMMDRYCQECHPDAVRDHMQSVHHFSSFNNEFYLFSVRETREVLMERDGNVQGARFCAGCHDPVPFFSGKFDDPNYDDLNDPTASEGVNCTVCHAITDVHGTIGNGNYTIEEPLHYPFAYSDNAALQWINHQLVKAKPAFHKKTFLKPLHKTGEFCATCHKVSLPYELNHYKEWLRGQNHWDNFLLSGVHGGGAQSWYYPQTAEANCNECHMPKKASTDFGAVNGMIHDHRFPGANTAVPTVKNLPETVKYQAEFLADDQVSLDIFAIKEGGTIGGELTAPIRPEIPRLEAGKSYLVEVVIRTLKVGHLFTQGTTDSNEIWLDVTARAGDRVIGRSGAMDEDGQVDPWSYFLRNWMLDREGKRIDRRNAQDIFVALYNHQQPPGTGQLVHFRLDVPADARGPISFEVALQYRKFDRNYVRYVYDLLREEGVHEGPDPVLPVVTMARDRVVFPVTGSSADAEEGIEPAMAVAKPLWQRWRDYGIGLFRQGNDGSDRGELRGAENAFREVRDLGQARGFVDLARVYEKEGRLDEARAALAQAVEAGVEETWTVNWLTARIDKQNGFLERAAEGYERVLATRIPERGFDFSKDYRVGIELGDTLLQLAASRTGEERERWLDRALERYAEVLKLDSENVSAHYGLMRGYRLRKDRERAEYHRRQHARYKVDDNARDEAVQIARRENPAASHAANAVVIYDLSRKGR
jgi:cytochrome c554/c'-like protein